MRHALFLLPLLLVACGGAKSSEVTVTIAGVTMADVAALQAELGKLPGVSAVRPGAFKDGQVVFALDTTRTGGELAAEFAKSATGLKNVKSFEAAAVLVSYDGASAPVAPAPTAKPEAAGPGPTPAPKKEETVKAQKDPLAYKMHQLPAGSIAVFEGWQIQNTSSDSQWSGYVTCPAGKENDFQLIVMVGTPDASTIENLFTEGPAYVQGQLPVLQPKGSGKNETFGGDPALRVDYAGDANGKSILGQAIFVKKQDVALGVLGIGTPEGFKEYGRSVEIVAQSVTLKQTALDPGLVGTWGYEKHTFSGSGSTAFSSTSTRYITIYPNGTFSESGGLYANTPGVMAQSESGNRGRLVARGNLLTFHYDDGKTQTREWKFEGGSGLNLNGTIYFKQ